MQRIVVDITDITKDEKVFMNYAVPFVLNIPLESYLKTLAELVPIKVIGKLTFHKIWEIWHPPKNYSFNMLKSIVSKFF